MKAGPVATKGEINRAGFRLRDWWMNPNAPNPVSMPSEHPLITSIDLALEWRSGFQRPLNTVTQGLRQFVRGVRCVPAPANVPVGQRLKRMSTIVDKLARMPTTKLTQLQDIGGCRAVLDGQAEVDAVLERIVRNWDLRAEPRNYVTHPKRSGYRAIHVVVVKRGRLIEVQLRTRGQHEWAVAVERMTHRLRQGIKFGVGPPDVLRFLEMAAEGIALTENGLPVDDRFMVEFEALRAKAEPYLVPPPQAE